MAFITKKSTGADLNNGANWVGGTAPGPGDVALFDATTGSGTWTLTAPATWGGISVTGVNTTITAASAQTLDIGASGVTASTGNFYALNTVSITLSASQTWTHGSSLVINVNAVTVTTPASTVWTIAGSVGGAVQTGDLSIGAVNLLTNATLQINGSLNAGSYTYAVNVGNSATFWYGGTAALTMLGVVSGLGNLGHNGSGTLSLPTANTFTGSFLQYAGTVVIKSNNSLGANTAIFYLAGGTFDTDTMRTIAQPIRFAPGANVIFGGTAALICSSIVSVPTAANPTLTVNGSSSNYLTFSAGVSYTTRLTVKGPNRLILGSGAGVGGFTLDGGDVTIDGSNCFGSGTTIINSGTIRAQTSARIITTNVTVNGSFTFIGATSLTFTTGTVTIANPATITVSSNTLTFAGTVAGSAALTKAGGSTLVLSGVNTFLGAFTIAAGALVFDSTGASSASNDVTIAASGAQLALGQSLVGNTAFIGTLSGVAGAIVTPNFGTGVVGLKTLSISQQVDATFDGTFQAGTLGRSIALVKTGLAKLTCTNNNGQVGTQVAQGTLKAQAANALGSVAGSASVTQSAGSTLQIAKNVLAGKYTFKGAWQNNGGTYTIGG